jgi:PAS domain S-box-containing protein
MEYRTGRIDELAGCGPIPQRAILDGIPDIIFVKDCDGRYLTCNAAFEAYVGRTEPDMVGRTDQDLFPPETAASYRLHDRVALASGRGCHNEEWITYPDGRRSLIDTLKTPCRGADGTLLGIAGISRDITARRLAEDALRETTERLTLAMRAGGVGTWAYDVAHNQLVWDDQMLRLYRVTRDQFSGAYDAWHVGVHPEDRQRGDAEIQLALEGKKEFDTVFRVLWPDGTTRTIRARATVQRDAAGQPLRMIGANWDVTTQKQTEEALQEANSTLENKVAERTRESVEESQRARQAAEQVNRDLKQAETRLVMHEKLAAIGRLAAGVAHELNNPIGFLMNNFAAMQDSVSVFGRLMAEYQNLRRKAGGIAELAADAARLEEQEKAGHLDFVLGDIDAMFEESREGFRRVMRIIQSMRDFTRIERAEEKSAYKINDAVQSTLEIAHNELKYHCTVEADYGATPPVLCVPGQVNQVLLNLVVNAAQAIAGQNRREKGTIGIRTYAEGEMVCCDVSDDGPGVPAAIRDEIFDPFYTTQPPGQGLGLSISYDIVVNRHGGTLEVDSREGGGCVFRLRLPRVPGRAPGEGAPS